MLEFINCINIEYNIVADIYLCFKNMIAKILKTTPSITSIPLLRTYNINAQVISLFEPVDRKPQPQPPGKNVLPGQQDQDCCVHARDQEDI